MTLKDLKPGDRFQLAGTKTKGTLILTNPCRAMVLLDKRDDWDEEERKKRRNRTVNWSPSTEVHLIGHDEKASRRTLRRLGCGDSPSHLAPSQSKGANLTPQGDVMPNKKTKADVEEMPVKKTKSEEPETLGTKDVARQLGMEPKRLRVILRSLEEYQGNDKARYSWEPGSKKLERLKAQVAEYEDNLERRRKEQEEEEEKPRKSKKAKAKKEEETEEELEEVE